MRGRSGGWIAETTTGCVALLAVIAGTVSHLHMHLCHRPRANDSSIHSVRIQRADVAWFAP